MATRRNNSIARIIIKTDNDGKIVTLTSNLPALVIVGHDDENGKFQIVSNIQTIVDQPGVDKAFREIFTD